MGAAPEALGGAEVVRAVPDQPAVFSVEGEAGFQAEINREEGFHRYAVPVLDSDYFFTLCSKWGKRILPLRINFLSAAGSRDAN